MTSNPIQDFLSQLRINFLGDNLMRKYENEKSPLRAELFGSEQLETYAVSLAATHILTKEPSAEQLINRLDENEAILKEVRNLLIQSAKQNSSVAPAGEWLLDNFYMIEEQINIGKKHFPKAYSETLPRLAKGPLAGNPRVYSIAIELISHSDGRIDPDNLLSFINAYQKASNLNLGELWAIPIMLRIALIENLRRLAGTIAKDHINKNLANYWADRMIETAEKDPKSLIIVTADMARSEPPMASSFVAELTRRLLGKGAALSLPLTWIEQRLSENGLATGTLIHQESQKQAADQVSMSNSIASLRFINNTDWREFVERTSTVDAILQKDINRTYEGMDFHTRDHYRHQIERIAKRSGKSEPQVAFLAIDLANAKASSDKATIRNTHVGYYLTGKGIQLTEIAAGIKLPVFEKIRRSFNAFPFLIYAMGIVVITLALSSTLIYRAYQEGLNEGWLIILGIISVIATSHLATAFVNWLSTILIPPDFLPRMDYSKHIPDHAKTLVAVPTLFNSVEELEDLVETMEVRYLANRQANIHFALLTDFRDAPQEEMPDDKALLDYAKKRIESLNEKYKDDTNTNIFFLFHRPRKWNAADKTWMGYERKRGKLSDLNELLRGSGESKFQVIAGDQTVLRTVRYVLTLDSDTQLPREAGWKIIGTISHPLNQPQYDEKKRRVTEGYGILQPRLATSLPHQGSSLYARIYGSEPGIDPYTRAVSDVYQDLVSEGSFIGKGIYDVDAFEKALGDRFPDNRILSHDLLEGCHARAGLISDVQLYEEYPASYLSDMKRHHRWMRGDWQIGRWMFPRVPGPGKSTQKNPLSALSRWKIFDNLRRSLVPPALSLMLLYGWLAHTSSWFWTFTVIGIIIPPALLSFAWTIFKKPKEIQWLHHTIISIESFVTQIFQSAWSIINLPYEAYLSIDAIARTLWRMFISGKNLLQWDPSHYTSGPKDLTAHFRIMWIGPVMGLLLMFLLPVISWPSFIIASPILILWILAPFIAWWMSIPLERKKASLSVQQNIFLRNLSRKTWAFFENFVTIQDNWLPPDNYQENPSPRIAHRTSPTNIGVSLLSSLAAHDFGYLTTHQLITRSHQTLTTVQSLEKYKGHLYNWYETQTLDPLYPRYVSTVDSGNLAACLLVLREGLLTLPAQPIVNRTLLDGISDTARILCEKSKDNELLQLIESNCENVFGENTFTIHSVKSFLENSLQAAETYRLKRNDNPDSETAWWTSALVSHLTVAYAELISLSSWLWQNDLPAKFDALKFLETEIPSLDELSMLPDSLAPKLEAWKKEANHDELQWLHTFESHIKDSQTMAKEMINTIAVLTDQCLKLSDYEYEFLFDKVQNYFSIGYNVEDHRRDAGFYDLLGSEARLGVYVAIAQGKIPQDSWFALGRQITKSGSDPVLISWSGSMFEYLMPLLVMPAYEASLLDQTHKGAVRRHIEYGNRMGLPWGISESCYNMVHANMDYQYRAFGVPGLGLKRGLGDDYVVAPYASIMALMVEPDTAYENLKLLTSEGFEGRWGYYEAIDYTPSRLTRGQSAGIVKAFMTHHQGMSFLSLAFLLLNQPMQKRFISELQFKTSLLLLQEKIPQVTTYYSPAIDVDDLPTEAPNTELRVINTPNTPVPEVQLLSNGRYHVMVSNSGGGYSRWKDLSVTRWREDGTSDNWGTFCYLRDLESKEFWSSTYQPVIREADRYEVIFSQGRAEFRRRDNNIETHTEIIVSPEDDIEIRRLHITNRGRKRRQIEATSYAEVVLNQGIAELLHPSFSNLFVQTEIIAPRHAVLCTRRPRAVEERHSWMFHLMKVHQVESIEPTYETSRDIFIGRGNSVADPVSMFKEDGLSGSEGSVLDPIIAIQYKIQLKAYESVIVDMVYGMGKTREDCQSLIEKYQDKHMIDRAFELAWTHSQVVLRQINATPADAMLYNRMAGSIIYANASLRTEPATIMKNQRGQSGLWSHSISGDWPIVLLQIEDAANISLVEKLIQAHSFWRLKGLVVDLVIWNEDHGGYRQVLHNQLLSLMPPVNPTEDPNKPGSIFIKSAEQLSNEDRILFQTVARIIITDKLGTLEGQLNRRNKLKALIPSLVVSKTYPFIDAQIDLPQELELFNGLGGFTENGKEYAIVTSPGNVTPAPWSNVIANPHFGTVISESGQSYTWFQNAHELRLTPWHNDPLTDAGGEHFYIRDEESGRYWSPSPLPVRGKTKYISRHGFGYSVFEHIEDGIKSEMWVFVDREKPIKYTFIKIRNLSGRVRQLTVTGYVEWVLGDLRHKTMMHIITELDLNSSAIIARNAYSTEFGQLVSFFDVNDPNRSITTDREEFIGRNRTAINPEAMSKSKLSGKTGASLDPCGVIQSAFNLEDGEENDIVFRLGTGMHLSDIGYLINQGRGRTATREALTKVIGYWENALSVIKVSTPDMPFDFLTNGWLNYQTISCRMWARSGYYQSGGAFGFRDQLQDVLSLFHSEPALARNQIILCASRQFIKGDVQHWWHPPVGRGVRTKCSDDYLWLPYVTAKYIIATGDTSILDENVQFLESRELAKGEHSYYDLPIRSEQHANLYTHCVRAIEYGLKFGEHGLPLIGSGDWNDGMDRVGTEGEGESVWLAWFLYETIQRFVEIAELHNDRSFLDKCSLVLTTLKENIEKNAWDGEWYRRAYFDDGTPLGSKENQECKIDSIAQSWSVLSGAGDPERSLQGMTQAESKLVRQKEKIIQLFDPPFDKSELNPGYIKGYVPGVRENGGQYTHAAIWMVMAFAAMRNKKKMWELLQIINPLNHGKSREEVAIYKVEPYVISADVYAVPQHMGRGGWSWYTGSSGWMYQLIIEYVLGISLRAGTLEFDPCLPEEWETVRVHYKYLKTIYNIEIIQRNITGTSIEIRMNGQKLSSNVLRLVDDGMEHVVQVEIT